MYMAQKAKKKSKLRHAEYYDMQKTFDSLYADSKSGEVFGHLMDIISAPSNIKLAFRNIKGNDGSHTAGTDGRTIESLAVMPEDKFVKLIQKQFRRYEPKAVKRVEIPKPNGKMRPLGIPCIIDRIVQQCILQVMEPICEAKFYEHSYGFRPCRSAENAISYAYGLAQRNKLHYVVDVDVAGVGNSQLGRHDVCSGVGEGILSECQSYYQSEQTACYRRTAATGSKVANLANVKE